MPPERLLRSKPGALGNAPERHSAGFEHLARGRDALAHQPFIRCEPGSFLEATQKRARAHACTARQRSDRVLLAQMRTNPIQQPRQPARLVGRDRARYELRLVAVTVRWNHQPLRDLIRDLRPVIAPYQMQQHVETCCRARRGQHLSLVDVQRVRLDANRWITLREQLRVTPVCRDALAVEHSSGSEHEDTRADRTEPRTASVHCANPLQQLRRRQLVRVTPARDDDRIGAIQQFDGVWRVDRDAAGRTQWAAFGSADGEVVPADVELRPRQSKQLDDAAELEGTEPVVGERDDEVGTRHGVMLPEPDDYASDARELES